MVVRIINLSRYWRVGWWRDKWMSCEVNNLLVENKCIGCFFVLIGICVRWRGVDDSEWLKIGLF